MALLNNWKTKFKSAVLGNDTKVESPSETTTFLTRQELLDALFFHFHLRQKEETTDESLLFATSFMVYMNQEDYQKRQQSFAPTVKDAVNKFNKAIRKEMGRYPDYRPHAEFWQFQFVPLEQGNLVEGMKKASLAHKEIFILSSIYPIRANNDGVGGAKNNERMVATVHDSKNSRTMDDWAINVANLSNLTILAKDQFQVSFNDFEEVRGEIKSEAPEDIARATIKITQSHFLVNDRRERAIYMLNDHLLISGRGGRSTSGGMPVARIDNDNIINEQITFHYRHDMHRLFMKAVGDVKLNEVPFSQLDLTNGWAMVPNKSAILINSEIQLEIIDIKK